MITGPFYKVYTCRLLFVGCMLLAGERGGALHRAPAAGWFARERADLVLEASFSVLLLGARTSNLLRYSAHRWFRSDR